MHCECNGIRLNGMSFQINYLHFIAVQFFNWVDIYLNVDHCLFF